MSLLREVSYREHKLEQLKKFVNDLDEGKDNRKLERNKSKKSKELYTMVQEVEESTKEIRKLIEAFLQKNRKYFGTVFGYEGTDYLESMEREIIEINEMIRVIRNEDDEKVFNVETRLFNGVIVDNRAFNDESP